ncbi:MAG: NYN domain-containing protein [Thermodesulfovibrionia bacterium]|nr:NYN domain-containing protein [Thermodesulfovibrionia bacterium]MCK5512165.1 NYN domain-containing protein [Thermodesulfovibrionia bacterium]
MAHILIDGYNLIGIAHKNLEKARTDIIEKLSEYSKQMGHAITIVFDGWKDGRTVETKMRTGNINVVYSRVGEKADIVIMRILSEDLKPWIVVSSDREIAGFANRKGFVCLSVDEFEDKLSSFFEEEVSGDSFTVEVMEELPSRQRGNPRKLSKKLKKKLRALRKL